MPGTRTRARSARPAHRWRLGAARPTQRSYSGAAAGGGERGLKKATLDLLLRFLRFCVTAAAVAALGFLTFGVMQRPFSRWLVRVSNATGVSTAGSLVAAIVAILVKRVIVHSIIVALES